MDIATITLIASIVMPLLSNTIQEGWRFLGKIKKSSCCGTTVEMNERDKEPENKDAENKK